MTILPLRIDPSLRMIAFLWTILVTLGGFLYLAAPPAVEVFNQNLMDAILERGDRGHSSGRVAVVDIDEASLDVNGQWPWPRFYLAQLLRKIQEAGPASVALTMILAEPDRTSLARVKASIQREFGYNIQTPGLPAHLMDNDAVLARVLSEGPFVLGHEFLFGRDGGSAMDCRLHPLEMALVKRRPGGRNTVDVFRADHVVCNIDIFSEAVSVSGFLNGAPDRDGLLRRVPLVIQFEDRFYPSLPLAALLRTSGSPAVQWILDDGGQSFLVAGERAIPVDRNGNLRVRFSGSSEAVTRVSASELLMDGDVADTLREKVVFVGLSASGLSSVYQTPSAAFISDALIHAQAADAIMAGHHIRRTPRIIHVEVALAVFLAMLFALGIVRFGLIPVGLSAVLLIPGLWQGSILLNSRTGVLMSPFLPVVLVLANVVVLSLFKYWRRQRMARKNIHDALILLKSSESRLNSIVKTIPDIVFRLDASGRITFISPAVLKYECRPEDLIGAHILEIVAEEDKPRATYRINERRTGYRATQDLEVRLLLAASSEEDDSRAKYFSISAEGVYAKDKPDARSFLGTQGIARDISKRKRLEQQLEKSQKMEAVGSLAAGVAHDLNNILGGLVSYPELLLFDLPEDSPMRKSLETIQQSGQRAAAIVQDMLTLARRGITVKEVVNLNTIITDYLSSPEFSSIQNSHPKVTLRTRLSEGLMNLEGSPIHISKILMNLINNAAEATPAGGCITLVTQNRYLDTPKNAYESIPEGEYVRLSIIDEGVGISAEDLPRIFEPFYTKKRMGQSGTGLGMTVIWSTVKDHAGYVDIISREGEGTRFDIFFPATREVTAAKESRIVLQDYVGSERLLVVDDIPEQREIAEKMLGKLGYDVVSVSSGEAAVEYLRENPVDLIVLDMVMPPGIDGLEAYRRIVAMRPGQKAIIASGYAESERVTAIIELGGGEFIRKPYSLERIGVAVRKELDRH